MLSASTCGTKDLKQMSSYFKPRHLRERQCIAFTKRGNQCLASTSEGRLCVATMLLKHAYTEDEEKIEDLQKSICLLACDKHRTFQGLILEDLIEKYRPEFDEYRLKSEPNETAILRWSQRNTRANFRNKLESRIKDKQFDSGYLYIFTWPYLPDYVKVGCSQGDPADRVKDWAKCYPDLTMAYSVRLSFPQRMEELIHLQMAERRHDVFCFLKSCKYTYHDEWFSSSMKGMVSVVKDYEFISKGQGLYDPVTRRLASDWDEILLSLCANPGKSINVRSLLEAAEALKLSKVLEKSTISNA